VTFGRFCDNRRGFETDFEANKIADVQCDQDFWNDHDEANETSHAAIGKYLFQSSKETGINVVKLGWKL
jgi:hypothetical protein